MTAVRTTVACEYAHPNEPHKTECGDTWTCVCGNQPWSSGFYACDEQGNEVEPTEKDWTSGLTFCGQCSRLIRSDTGELVGSRAENATYLP